jgi:hypothetical protein
VPGHLKAQHCRETFNPEAPANASFKTVQSLPLPAPQYLSPAVPLSVLRGACERVYVVDCVYGVSVRACVGGSTTGMLCVASEWVGVVSECCVS